uniref:Reelin domain-containing protein n=1 Tax=Plectus sambesii TaxID=2011161 RepID=A0A914WS78_9BILA
MGQKFATELRKLAPDTLDGGCVDLSAAVAEHGGVAWWRTAGIDKQICSNLERVSSRMQLRHCLGPVARQSHESQRSNGQALSKLRNAAVLDWSARLRHLSSHFPHYFVLQFLPLFSLTALPNCGRIKY